MRNILGFLAAPVAALLALPAVLVALPFTLVARATRWLANRLSQEAAAWHEVIRFDPEVGWTPKPMLETYHEDVNGDTYSLRTDGDGWRGVDTTIGSSQIVAYGDSYAFGFAIGESSFFGNLPGDPRIKAVGAPGYNMVQTLLLMERHAADLRGKLVVWLIYPGNDLDDNLRPSMERWRMPFVRRDADEGRWEIVTRHISPEEWTFPSRVPSSETYLEICTPGSHLSRRAFGACEFLIGRAKRLCDAAGARLAVATIPDFSDLAAGWTRDALDRYPAADRFDPELPDRKIEEMCRRLDVPFRSLREDLSAADYRRHDVHWTASGHRRVAEVLRGLARWHAEEYDTVEDVTPSVRGPNRSVAASAGR